MNLNPQGLEMARRLTTCCHGPMPYNREMRSWAESWHNRVVDPGQSDLEHKNIASVWPPLTEGCFIDLDFTFWGMGIWSATMNNKQRTTGKIPLVCNCCDAVLSKPLGRHGEHIE